MSNVAGPGKLLRLWRPASFGLLLAPRILREATHARYSIAILLDDDCTSRRKGDTCRSWHG